MPEYKAKLTGRQAVAVVVVLAGIVGARLLTFNDRKSDKGLMRALESQLISEYLPNEAAKLKAASETGDANKINAVVESVTSAKLNVEAVQASYPLFDFSTPQDVVVKVTYSLKDASGTRDRKTNYYLFTHGVLGNSWQYKHATTAASYYLNFL